MESTLFDLAVCAEMVFLDLPFEQRVRRIADSGFGVEILVVSGLGGPV
jgi:hydroxypyruvate isomerase